MDSIDCALHKDPFRPWEYVVDDFLELGCHLGDHPKRDFLLKNLRQHKPYAKAIQEHPCFSLGTKLIIICKEVHPKECWVYFPKKVKILKWRLANRNHHKKENNR